MRFILLAVVVTGLHTATPGQSAKPSLVASTNNENRISVVRNSLSIPEWHEKSFWPVYENYLKMLDEASAHTYNALGDLARSHKQNASPEAYQYAEKLIANRFDGLAVKERYFKEIGGTVNGVVALQFLQTEALLDMIESAKVYEESSWLSVRSHFHAIASKKTNVSKRAILPTVLDLNPIVKDKFWDVYNRYEEERDAILGENFNVFELYFGEASDFTPALAKRLGHELLHLMQREVKLKEKYLYEMKNAVGASLAAQFLACEDYFSVVSKMRAWADAP